MREIRPRGKFELAIMLRSCAGLIETIIKRIKKLMILKNQLINIKLAKYK